MSGKWRIAVFPDIGNAAPDDQGPRGKYNNLIAGAIGLTALAAVVACGWWLLLAAGGNAGSASRSSQASPAQQAVADTRSATTGTYDAHGQRIIDKYLVTNAGNVTLDNLHVIDTRYGQVACPEATLAPGASMTCTLTNAVSGFSSSSATGTSPGGGTVMSDPPDVTVTPEEPVEPEQPSPQAIPVARLGQHWVRQVLSPG